MILKEQLEKLKGYDVKISALTSFFYCGICDENIENVLNKLSEKELKRLKDYKSSIEYFLKKKPSLAKKLENDINKLNNRIEEFKPFLEREVIEVYDSILYKNEKIIKIIGEEIGKYWTKEEYKKEIE